MIKNDLNLGFSIKNFIFVEVGPSMPLPHAQAFAGLGPARPGLAGQAWPNQANVDKIIGKYGPCFQAIRLHFFVVFP